MPDFYVLSLKHTMRRHKAITLWRTDDKGYCWMLASAGTYSQERVMEHLGYYNSGHADIAVPVDLVRNLVCEVEYDTKEFGVCLPNTRKVWDQLIAGAVAILGNKPKPEYRRQSAKKAA